MGYNSNSVKVNITETHLTAINNGLFLFILQYFSVPLI